MAQKNEARHCSNCQVTIETTVTVEDNKPGAFTKKKRRRKTNTIPKQNIKPKISLNRTVLLQFNSFIVIISF